jgi:hypothetical protein
MLFAAMAALVLLFAMSLGLAGEIEPNFKTKLLSMPPDSEISALIFIQDKLDIANLAAQLNAINADRATRNRTVIAALKDKASATQSSFLTYLAEQKIATEVKEYRAFWIDNVIFVRSKVRTLLAAENIPNVNVPYQIKENIATTLRGSEPNAKTSWRSSMSTTAAAESNLKYINAHRVWNMGLHGEGRLVCIFDTGANLHIFLELLL